MYALTSHTPGFSYVIIDPPNDGRTWDVVAMTQGTHGSVTILWKTDDA